MTKPNEPTIEEMLDDITNWVFVVKASKLYTWEESDKKSLESIRDLIEHRLAVRDSIGRFAVAMEKILRAHDYRPGWSGESAGRLLGKLEDEVGELREAIASGDKEKIKHEATDVGNFAMMIFDNVLAVYEKAKEKN